MGPLGGLRIIEMAGIGPCPFAGMLFADLGAEVIRVDRTGESGFGLSIPPRFDVMNRGKKSIAIDLKTPAGRELTLDLIGAANVVIEGFRPGVMERLGLGPEPAMQRNPSLIYGRVTGWGQTGPLAQTAGHDINYISLTGALGGIGTKERPTVPLNLIGDFGGGSMFLAVGVLAALFEARRTGKGQVVDAAIVDGAALLGTMFHGLLAGGFWKDAREVNELDGGSPWYDCYQTSDGKSVSVGAIEGKFYDQLVQRLGFARNELPDRSRRSNYPALRQALADRIASKTLAEWTAIMDGSDACFAPVLNWGELVNHPHNADRNAYLEIDGITHPAPAPRFDRSAPATPGKPSRPGDSTRAVLRNAGLDDRAIDALAASGTVAARD